MYVIYSQPSGTVLIDGIGEAFTKADGSINFDKSYPWLVGNFVPVGLKGLVVAALAAAIVSSLASMLNSTATIFTMDIYKPYFNKGASDRTTVSVGRITVGISLLIACLIAPFLDSIPQAFQYIQEYTGIVSPGIFAIFLLGLFWKKTNSRGAITGAIISIPVAALLKSQSNRPTLPGSDVLYHHSLRWQ